MAKKNELAVLDTFKLATPFDGLTAEEIEEMQDELKYLDEGSGIECRTVKMPSGGALAFEITDEDDEVEYVKELQGVVVFTHAVNAYWANSLGDGKNQPPTCSSMDGKTGINTETGECVDCDTCLLNKFRIDEKGVKKKACKNMRRLYLILDGDPNFYRLTAPPTSIKDVNDFLKRITMKPPQQIGTVVSVKLEKKSNDNGVEYAKIVMKKVGALSPQAKSMASEMRKQIAAKFHELAITQAEYNAPQQNPIDVTVDDEDVFPAPADATPPAPEFEEAPPLPDDGQAPFA